MMRRRSNRFAACSSRPPPFSASAPSVRLISSSSRRFSSAMIALLPEDDGQDGADAERAEAEQRWRFPPLVLPGALVDVGHAPDEALKLLDGLGPREQRHGDGDDRVDDEGGARAPERLVEVRAEVEPAGELVA